MKSFTVDALGKSLLYCLLLAPLAACAAGGSSDSRQPYRVDSRAGARLNVVPLDRFDSPWSMTFQTDQSLLRTKVAMDSCWKTGQMAVCRTSVNING